MRRLVAFSVSAIVALAANNGAPVTFNKDILPIMQTRCQECHRPGEAAPMSLLTYQQARPWAKAIKEAVAAQRMPPWFADPHFGTFSNDRSMTGDEIRKITAWADQGAPEGDAKDKPKPREFVEGWNIGQPDAVFPMGSEYLLRVPRYDFNWQLFYYLKEPMLLPKGTRIECTAHFDNSANNKANPDPTKEVRWGDQSWEEMMIGWFDVAVDVNKDKPAPARTGE